MSRTCAVENCGRPVRARGWCAAHYKRWLATGDVRADVPFRGTVDFWDRVDRSGDCWTWTASVDSDGYGHLGLEGKLVLAHRLAFYLTHGYWPNVCRHICDNPPCVNPAHLLDGTQADNIRDMVERGRMADIGEHNRAKTHCPQGHPYDEANTVAGRRGNGRPFRMCRACKRESEKRRRARLDPGEIEVVQ